MVRSGIIAGLIWFLTAVLAVAQTDLPALYDVTGVASNDVLNVRAGPSASTAIVGALAHTARDVEVVARSADGRWGLVNRGEGAGWASLRFLARQPGQPGNALPKRLSCFGTEPFWSLDLRPGRVTLSTPSDSLSFDPLTRQTASGRPDRYSFIATEVLREVHGVVRRTACNDGMSDREFGFDIDLIMLRNSNATHLSGCCSLAQ